MSCLSRVGQFYFRNFDKIAYASMCTGGIAGGVFEVKRRRKTGKHDPIFRLALPAAGASFGLVVAILSPVLVPVVTGVIAYEYATTEICKTE